VSHNLRRGYLNYIRGVVPTNLELGPSASGAVFDLGDFVHHLLFDAPGVHADNSSADYDAINEPHSCFLTPETR